MFSGSTTGCKLLRLNSDLSPRFLQDEIGINRRLIAILLAAFLARGLFVSLFSNTLSLDGSGYDSYAQHVLAGQGYTRFEDRTGDSDLPPLYPGLMVLTYQFLGRGAIQMAIVQTAMECVTIGLLYLVGREIAGTQIGLLAAALYAFYPYMFYQTLTPNDTGLFTLLLVTLIWLAYRVCDHQRWTLAAACGLVLGLAALTKPWALLLLPLLGVWWSRQLGARSAARLIVPVFLVSSVTISPWLLRNSLLHGELTFISTNDGSNLYQGNNPCVVDYLRRGWDAQWVDCLNTPPDGLNELALDRWYRQQALAYLGAHPDRWLELATVKLAVLWTPVLMPTSLPPGVTTRNDTVRQYSTPAFQLARGLHLATFTPLLILGLAGWMIGMRRGVRFGPLLAAIAANAVTFTVFHPSTRYRSPVDPFVILMASYAAVSMGSALKRLRQSSRV